MTPGEGASLELEVPVTRPYHARALLAYLGARAMAGVEQVGTLHYRRVVRLAGKPRLLTVDFSQAEAAGTITARCTPGTDLAIPILHRKVVSLVDANAPVDAIERQLAEDPALAPLVRRNSGSRIPGSVDPFELTVRAILGQQISVVAARTLAARVASRWGPKFRGDCSGLKLAFPGPQHLADAPLETAGLSRARAGAIREISQALLSGQIGLEYGQDSDATERSLLSIKGIGPWTAAYVALRGIGSGDAIPVTDLGLRQALGDGSTARSNREVAEQAESWRPWRGYGAVHLWNTFLPL